MKKILIIFIVLLVLIFAYIGRSREFQSLEGDWQVVKFYNGNNDLTNDNYIMNLEGKYLWLKKRVDGKHYSIKSNFNIHKDLNTLQIDLKKCDDNRFNGNYNLYIDTIQDNEENYIIRLTLDSENTFIEAIRSKLKYYSYEEFTNKTTK